MAQKPTIYKLRIALSDLNRHHYDTLNLTTALHPSETLERMMVRILAYCINVDAIDEAPLSFTKGLNDVEQPDIWARTLDDQIAMWIDVGEPALDRIKKASSLAHNVKVYSFNTKSDVWWPALAAKLKQNNVAVFRFNWDEIKALAALVERTMDLSVTITGDSAYVAAEAGEVELGWQVLQDAS